MTKINSISTPLILYFDILLIVLWKCRSIGCHKSRQDVFNTCNIWSVKVVRSIKERLAEKFWTCKTSSVPPHHPSKFFINFLFILFFRLFAAREWCFKESAIYLSFKTVIRSEKFVDKCVADANLVWTKANLQNIARGTTDPGYKVYNLNYLFNFYHEVVQVNLATNWRHLYWLQI